MFAPRIVVQHARGDRATLGTMLKRVTYWNVVLTLPVFAALLLLSRPLLGLFGGAYEKGAAALTLLAAGQLVNAATGPLGQMINMSGRPYITMLNNAFVAALNVGLCLVLIPRYGVTGAACATVASITLVNLIKLVQVRVIFGVHSFDSRTVRALAVAALAIGVASPVAFAPAWPNDLAEVVAAGFVLVATYVAGFWALATSAEEREFVRVRVRRAAPSRAAQVSTT
jgi:O-antigen/teichoic acid export membrane protein